MDQHPIPRQITTFEFKLIGFLTIKQFIYLLVFFSLGYIFFLITPIPLLNYVIGIVIGAIGLALAFLPINDRPLDIWIKNFIKRLTSPTQYTFKKENKPPTILLNLSYSSSPQIVANHLDAQKKLNNYLSSKNQSPPQNNKKNQLNNLLSSPLDLLMPKKSTNSSPTQPATSQPNPNQANTQAPKQPFISGIVKNFKQTPLAGILIYVKKEGVNQPLRILKTNSHGVFASFNPLPNAEYLLEIKDPKGQYFFDTMKIKVNNINQPITIQSKEMI
ncbi:MAG: PrgI family protein [Microgenomates group bacterium]